MSGEFSDPGRYRLRTARMEAFSDGVFAIAITLLVLELEVPAGSGDDLLGEVVDLWPSYLAYVISFASIGAAWLGHSAITEYLSHADRWLLRLNLLLLMVVSFLPFPTKLLAEHVGDPKAERVAATVYGCTLLLAALLQSIMWRYAVYERLVRSDAQDTELKILTKKLTPGLAGYLAMIILGLFLPLAAILGYLVIALYFLIPLGLKRQHFSRA